VRESTREREREVSVGVCARVCARVCVCVCECVYARARVCVCEVSVGVCAHALVGKVGVCSVVTLSLVVVGSVFVRRSGRFQTYTCACRQKLFTFYNSLMVVLIVGLLVELLVG
jgi:hypothetical protein